MLVEMNIQDEDQLDNCYDFMCGNSWDEVTLGPASRVTNEKDLEDNDYKSLNYIKIWLSFIMHVFFFFICNLIYDTNFYLNML